MKQDKLFLRFTEIYIIALAVFLLCLPPIEKGYTKFADFKYGAFLVVCSGYVLCVLLRLAYLWIVGRFSFSFRKFKNLPFCARMLFVYGGFAFLSVLFSPHAPYAIIGGFRYGGFLSLLILLCSSFFVFLFYRPKKYHIYILVGTILCYCSIGILQLMGKNPLFLYPSYNFYSAVPMHKAVFFSTSGNADHGGAVLSMAIGILSGLLLLKKQKLCLVPLFFCLLCSFYLQVDALLVALLGGLFLLLPVVFSFGILRGVSFYSLFASLCLACFFFSFSENGMAVTPMPLCFLCFPLLVFGLFFLQKGKAERIKKRYILFLCGLFFAGLLCLKLYPFSSPLFLKQAHLLLNGVWEDSFGSGRFYIWRQSIPFLFHRPLLGIGPDCIGFLPYEPFTTYDAVLDKTFTASITAAHNQYLHIALCQGFWGLFAYLALLVSTLKKSMGAFSCPHAQMAAFGVLFYCIQAFFGIDFISTAPIFWLLVGISMQSFHVKST